MITLVFINSRAQILSTVLKSLRVFALVAGIWFLIMVILSFTSLPFWMYYNLSYTSDKLNQAPNYIVVMSGSGIPSESGLMRTYKAAEVASEFPLSKVIIAMPGDISNSTSSCYLMKKELMMRGVEADRIGFENHGTNTRSQAVGVGALIEKKSNVLIVTSPEHVFRTVKSFKRVGFEKVSSQAAFDQPVEASFLFNDDELGGNTMVPEIGENTKVRYQFWVHFKYQIIVYREYCALAYYWLKDWV